MRTLSLAVVLILSSSCGAASLITPATASAAPTSSAAATLNAKGTAYLLSGIIGRAVVSPDGKWIGATDPQPNGKVAYVPAVLLYDISGKLVRKVELPTPNWTWMPDSSGLFVALDAPQHASSLGIVEVGVGDAKPTGLLMSHTSLSRDGKWIIAEHQEGCCTQVAQREIWIAPRTGGDTKVLVRSKTAGISLLGIDAADRLVYRDGTEIFRVPIAGGTPQSLAISADFVRTLPGGTSPDAQAILVRGFEPLRWYILSKDSVTVFDATAGDVVDDQQGTKLLFNTDAIWIAPHEFLVSGSSGLVRVDTVTGSRAPLAGALRPGDVALTFGSARLLVARGTRGILIDTTTGQQSDIGIDLGTDSGARAFGLPSGGFILTMASATYLSTASATYRID